MFWFWTCLFKTTELFSQLFYKDIFLSNFFFQLFNPFIFDLNHSLLSSYPWMRWLDKLVDRSLKRNRFFGFDYFLIGKRMMKLFPDRLQDFSIFLFKKMNSFNIITIEIILQNAINNRKGFFIFQLIELKQNYNQSVDTDLIQQEKISVIFQSL